MDKKIHLSLAKMCGEEEKFIKEALNDNWVAPVGPNITGFEEDLKTYLEGEKHIVALNSGTAAIHLGLIQLGVQSGDEVICQSFTFVASANPIIYLGAKPVFVDSEEDSWNMSPQFLRIAIEDRILKTGKKPKAIIPVHIYGMPAKMDEIMTIALEFEIPVLEDAAEALGSVYKGRNCGTFGDFACFSFNGNKIITTSGGGALVCNTDAEAEKTLFYATQARDEAPHYEHSQIGYNYRMSNISAGIGRGQMYVLKDNIQRRRDIHELYTQLMKNTQGITVIQNPSEDFNSNFWLTCIIINSEIAGITKNEIINRLLEENIECRPLWKPLHLQPVYKEVPFYGDGTSEDIFNNGLCLPSGITLSDNDILRVVNAIQVLQAEKS